MFLRRAAGAAVVAGATFATTLAMTTGCVNARSRGFEAPADARTTVLSLAHADCASCAERLASTLRARPGVYRVSFDRRRVEMSVLAAPSFDALTEARALAKNEAFEVVAGAGRGSYLPWPEPPPGVDERIVIRDGADVPDLAALLVPNKTTVLDFSATWCEPCRKLDEHMVAIAAKRRDVAYRKLDVADWDSPLALHYLKGVTQLPYVIVFDRTGRRLTEFSGFDVDKLDGALGASGAGAGPGSVGTSSIAR